MNPTSQALTATVIVIGTPDRLTPAAEALEERGEAETVRVILISQGPAKPPVASANAIVVAGLPPRFLNNAVAALRLSSLPAVVWWRGGSVGALEDLASLADRLVLDLEDPADVWSRAPALFERTAVTDLRWARMTRWRGMLARLFGLPQVLAAAGAFTRLTIEAADVNAARLFAGWLAARLQWGPGVGIAISQAATPGGAPLRSVRLEGPDLRVSLSLRPTGTCLEAAVEGTVASTRAVPLANGGLAALIGEELAVRTRDLAFEQALARAQEIRA